MCTPLLNLGPSTSGVFEAVEREIYIYRWLILIVYSVIYELHTSSPTMVIEKGFELDSYEEHHSSIYEENESSHAEREERDRRERRLKWKLDLTVLPLLSLTYFLSSMVCSLTFRYFN